MVLTNFSNLRIIHTAGTSLTVSDTLSRDFTTITNKTCQIQLTKLPPHIDFILLNLNNSSEKNQLFS